MVGISVSTVLSIGISSDMGKSISEWYTVIFVLTALLLVKKTSILKIRKKSEKFSLN